MKDASKIVVNHVLNQYSVDLSIFEESYLDKCIRKSMESSHSLTVEDYVIFLSDESNFSNFHRSIYNGYTTFFRDLNIFHFIDLHFFDLFNLKNKELRAWSIGCSKGQEVYSYAILFEEIIRRYNLDFKYIIFGTDLSEMAIQYAKKGIFTQNELENLTLKQLDMYFDKINNKYQIKDFIKQKVQFSYFDIVLAEENYPKEFIYGKFDIVSCSNVLIYYNQMVQSDIIGKIMFSTRDNGIIITSNSEIKLLEQQSNSNRVLSTVPIIQLRKVIL